MDLIVAFITGFTTGGLSCLAIQGGLLASTLAYQLEQDLQAQGITPEQRGKLAHTQKFQPRIAQPISLFLFAKLIAYTLLGLLLGALGSILKISPLVSALLMILIGIFLVGNGLRMLNVHPIFRYFILEPPSFITRYIRRKSKNGASLVTPLMLGALTVFLPCGVAQAMMAVALGTGDPWQGAAILLSFTLGTTPVFFAVAYFATRLGATLENYFTRIVAVTVLVLGMVSINSGLNLAGSPFSVTNLYKSMTGGWVYPAPLTTDSGLSNPQGYYIHVTDDGYSPAVLHLPANKDVELTWITTNTTSCALAIVVPDLKYQAVLQKTGKQILKIPAQEKGTVMRYSCSMGMYTGQLVFDQD